MKYIDGYVLAVPTANRERYIALATTAAAVFKDVGALRVLESWGDDVPPGKLTSFPMAVQCEPNETVVFSWVEWPSKQIRDLGMQKFMADPRMASCEMPFDGKRMILGGFDAIVDA
jgi:uncharacterized protein YbaA (DUF1428 family)